MDDIRQAFMTEWGEVPLLETYRQMAIRQQKAGDFEQALWWAERGIAVYGDDAARPEAVEDLQHRAAAYRAKLAPASQAAPWTGKRRGRSPGRFARRTTPGPAWLV